MTISTTSTSETVSGDASQTTFTFPFVGVSTSDLNLIYTDSLGNQTSIPSNEFTSSLNSPPVGGLWGIGGQFSYPLAGSPIPIGSTITMERVLPITQVTSLDNQGNQYPQAIESALDTLCMQIQQVNQTAQLSLQIPVTDTIGTDTLLPSAQMRANNVLAFNAVGTPIVISAASLAGGGLSFYDNLVISGSAQTSPVAYVSLSAVGPDPSIGITYNSKGTTTLPNQFNGNVENGTGRQKFYINGCPALELTDTYANVNTPYSGAVNGWPILSSGWGDSTNSSDAFAGMLSVESAIYPGGIPTGLTLLIGSKGPSGEIHFVGNGALGHVSVSYPVGTKTSGAADEYELPNGLFIQGSYRASGQNVLLSSSPSGHASDVNIGMTFYNYAPGPFIFTTGNTNATTLSINYVASPINYINITAGASGINPIVWASGTAGQRLTLAGADTGGVDICNGGQYNGTAACAPIARFYGSFESSDYLMVTASASSNAGVTLGVGSASDTNAPLVLMALGTGSIALQSSGVTQFLVASTVSATHFIEVAGSNGSAPVITTNGGDLLLSSSTGFVAYGTFVGTPATSAGYIMWHDAGGTARKIMVGT